MSAIAGRKITISKDSGSGPDALQGLRSKTITYGAETIDITSDDDDGYRALLTTSVAQRQLDIAVEGMVKDDEWLEIAASDEGLLSGVYTVNLPGIGTVSGTFVFSGFEKTGTYNDAVTFSATMQSSGAFTVTPLST